MNDPERNIIIDSGKILYTILIAVFHFFCFNKQFARGGFIGVEFFFIISGFLLANSFEKIDKKDAGVEKFIVRRLVNYYPHYIFSLIILFIFKNAVVDKNNIDGWICAFKQVVPEIFLLHGTIISDEETIIFNSCTWYLSILLIIEYFVWCVLAYYRNKEKFKIILRLIPVFDLTIYAYIYYQLGTLTNWRSHTFSILNYGTLRALAGVAMGVYIFYFDTELATITKALKGKHDLVMKICGETLIFLPFVLSFISYNLASFAYVLMFSIGILIVTNVKTVFLYESKMKHVISYLAKISYGVYLNHYFIGYIFISCLNSEEHFSWGTIVIYLIVTFIYSAGTVKFVDFAMMTLKKKVYIKHDYICRETD